MSKPAIHGQMMVKRLLLSKAIPAPPLPTHLLSPACPLAISRRSRCQLLPALASCVHGQIRPTPVACCWSEATRNRPCCASSTLDAAARLQKPRLGPWGLTRWEVTSLDQESALHEHQQGICRFDFFFHYPISWINFSWFMMMNTMSSYLLPLRHYSIVICFFNTT
jgi:hypothetical protein